MALKRSKSISIVFLAMTFILVLVLAGDVCGGEPQRAGGSGDICRKASYVKLCRAIVKGQKSPYEATSVTVKQLIVETEAATRKALAEKKKGGIPKQLISVCKENYESALSDLHDSLSSMRARDMGTLNSCLSATITYYSTCDDAFIEDQIPSPLAKTNARLKRMASNALFLASLWP